MVGVRSSRIVSLPVLRRAGVPSVTRDRHVVADGSPCIVRRMVDELLAGHGRFRAEYAADGRAYLARLARDGQRPAAMLVGCADSRVIPELLTGADPGELFVVRNVANVIPPSGSAAVSVGAALEFAIGSLGIRHLIVCGHDVCGGVSAVLDDAPLDPRSSLAHWLEHVAAPVRRARVAATDPAATLRRAVEENVLEQLANALSYPVVQDARDAGRLDLHGWVYDIGTLELRIFEPAMSGFCAGYVVTPAGRRPWRSPDAEDAPTTPIPV